MLTLKGSLKARLHIQFLHAVSEFCCNFLSLTLIEQNQDKLLKIVAQCGKRMLKPDVKTQLKSFKNNLFSTQSLHSPNINEHCHLNHTLNLIIYVDHLHVIQDTSFYKWIRFEFQRNGKPTLLVHCQMSPLNHKRTTSSFATPMFYVAK